MKTKRYLRVMIKTLRGTTIANPLKLSESHLISKIAQENDHIFLVRLITCSDKEYKTIFG